MGCPSGPVVSMAAGARLLEFEAASGPPSEPGPELLGGPLLGTELGG